MDTLTVRGVGRRIDGDYEVDLTALLVDVTSPDALLVSEAETIKRLSGARGYEIAEGFLSGDWIVRMAVATVVLARHGVKLSDATARAATVGAFSFVLREAPDEDEEEEEGDDTATPPGEGVTPSANGGEFGRPTLDADPASDPAPIGRLASAGS